MKKRVQERKIDTDTLLALSSLPPILQRVYASRNVRTMEDLNRSLSGLLPYHNLLDIDKAAQRIATAIRQNEHILVIGDFDADGATSTAVAIAALRMMGANRIDFLVPNRFTFGYGLTPEIVEVAKQKSPELLITVDNGIASIEGVLRANQLGIDVIITDHHLPGDELPQAFAIVDPNRKNDPFQSKMMAGVGVIFYVMLAVRAHLNVKINLASLLDLVALGTIADVVPLDKNNRILVHQGLQRIRAGRACVGIQSLLKIARVDFSKINSEDLGFSIGPRLNAAGRLDDMSLGISCLLATNIEVSDQYAVKLNQLNHERRIIENEMKQQAFDIVDRLEFSKQLPLGICLYNENWHQGVIGLAASRVKDKLNRPVIVFAKAENEMLKGSARSISGIHIRDVLDGIAKKHPDCLSKFGGHAMAAGLTIRQTDFIRFQSAFVNEIGRYITEEQLQEIIEIDGKLQGHEFTLENAMTLMHEGPWGQGFSPPLFYGEFDILSQRLVGGIHLKMLLKHPGCSVPIDAIAFQVEKEWPNHRCTRINAVYRLVANEYKGCKKLQLIIEELLI